MHGKVFLELDLFWANARKFFYTHKTLSDIMFLGIYFFEQVLLFILTLVLPDYSYVFAGFFALILITTISFEKVCMESRYTHLTERTMITERQVENLQKAYSQLENENNLLMRQLRGSKK
jgi:hypothetical protein